MTKNLVVYYSRKGERFFPSATVAEDLSIQGHQCESSKEMLAGWATEHI